MASNEKLIIRTMQRDDVKSALDWAVTEGWNPGFYDDDCFFFTDTRGFFIGEIDGEPIGCIAAVAYNDSFGFIGLYIVKPEFRGKGYGIQLWKYAMNHLGNRTIGLDGVIDQQENYKKSGFRLAYRNIRYEGINETSKSRGSISQCIVDLTDIPFEELVTYDSQLFCSPRPQFLKRWINQPEGYALGFLKKGKISGYGVIRACHEGFKIGPLFADEEQIAEDLFNSLTGRITGETVFLDTPEANPAAIALAKRHNMTMVFETARMYNKKPSPLPLHRIFGVTSLELG